MRFSVLDSLRGVCAILVALYHFEVIGKIYGGHLNGVAIVNNAYLFVDFFFVLSGFVIAHTYQTRIGTAAELRAFAIRRFGRIWPLHMAVLLAFIGLELAKLVAWRHGAATELKPFSDTFSIPSIFSNIALVQSFGLHSGLTWNMPSWSISVEFYTYLLFGVVALRLRGRIVAASAALAIGAAVILLIFARDPLKSTFDYGILRCLYGFFVGVLTLQLYRASPRFGPPSRNVATVLEVSVVLVVALLVMTAETRAIGYLLPPIFGAAVYVFAAERGAVSSLLLARPFTAAGAASYSIYATQALVLIVIERIIRVTEAHFGTGMRIDAIADGRPQSLIFLGSAWRSDALIVLYLALLFLVAAAAYRYIEAPGRSFFNSVARGERPAGAARRVLSDLRHMP